MIYGAFVTVKYWCPNLCADSDLEITCTTDKEKLQEVKKIVKDCIKSEGVLGLCASEEIVSIEIKDECEKK